MKCIVSSFGSAGDFFPTLALGAALRRRGHDVRFVANPFYEPRARAAGLELTPAGEFCDIYERFEQTPAYGDPANAGMLFRDLIAPHTVATYRVVGDLLRSEAIDVVVANDAGFGALWAAKERNVPSVVAHASPMIWMSGQAPLVLGDRALPTSLARLLTVGVRGVMSWYLTRLLRISARQVGTSLSDVSFAATESIPAIRLGLWSPLLRGPVATDPANGTICGFTRSSRFGATQPELSPEVEAFLARGPAPVVVGFGSAFSLISGPMLTEIAAACADRGLRCLVVGHPSGLTFPSNTLAVRYAPYDKVFPRAAAVVVHCGAGTTGEALRCGKPIIAVPFAYDQFALCAAIEQLGVALRVPVAKRTRSDFGRVLDRVPSDAVLRERAAEMGQRFSDEPDGAECGADRVERFFAARRVA